MRPASFHVLTKFEHHFCRVFVCPNMGFFPGYTVPILYTPFGEVGRSWFRGAMLKKFGPTLSGLPFITAAKTIPFHGKVIKKWIHDDTCGYWIPPTSLQSMVNGQFIHLCNLGSLTWGFPWALAIVGNTCTILPGL